MGISGWWWLSVHHDQGRLVRRSNSDWPLTHKQVAYGRKLQSKMNP